MQTNLIFGSIVKYKTSFNFLLFLWVFSSFSMSCSSRIDTDIPGKNNREEIEELKKELQDLNEQKDTLNSDDANTQIEELRKELITLINALSDKIDSEINMFKTELESLNDQLSDLSDNTVTKSEYVALVKEIEREYLKKRDVVLQNGQIIIDVYGEEEILERLEQLEKGLSSFRDETSEKIVLLEQKWDLKLKESIAKSKQEITEEIKDLIKTEISYLKIEQEGFLRNLKILELKVSELTTQYNGFGEEEIRNIIDNEIALLEKEIEVNTQKSLKLDKEIADIKEYIQKAGVSSTLVDDVVLKLFKPCKKGLSSNDLCYTMGVLINKFGGEFLDPLSFPKTKDGLVSYLSLSGIKSKAAIANIDSYIISTERETFNKCFPGKKYMIAPREFWPHLVVNSFLFEKISKVIDDKKSLGLVDQKVESPSRFIAWYRNECYQKEFVRRGLTTATVSDHMFGAAVDVSFINLSEESFAYYNAFVESEVFEKDIFDLLTPLSVAGLSVQARHGHGIGGSRKFHLGILSKNKSGDAPYIIYNY